ncbi:unnamed protein product [Taenia asiatica]|uniref:Uncharacterized protein n=1 Tax=Taenia asiatica TaxID=60517 RepID=A0A3P6QQ72_TAEAS|nr:unnamed protein product [Taenia asiatica]
MSRIMPDSLRSGDCSTVTFHSWKFKYCRSPHPDGLEGKWLVNMAFTKIKIDDRGQKELGRRESREVEEVETTILALCTELLQKPTSTATTAAFRNDGIRFVTQINRTEIVMLPSSTLQWTV